MSVDTGNKEKMEIHRKNKEIKTAMNTETAVI